MPTTVRRVPPDETIRSLMCSQPLRSNGDWAKEWGVSRERIRQLRIKLGLRPASEVHAEAREVRIRYRAEQKQKQRATPRPFPCPVCDGPVPGDRLVTCSRGCARQFSGNSKYRLRRDKQRAAGIRKVG